LTDQPFLHASEREEDADGSGQLDGLFHHRLHEHAASRPRRLGRRRSAGCPARRRRRGPGRGPGLMSSLLVEEERGGQLHTLYAQRASVPVTGQPPAEAVPTYPLGRRGNSSPRCRDRVGLDRVRTISEPEAPVAYSTAGLQPTLPRRVDRTLYSGCGPPLGQTQASDVRVPECRLSFKPGTRPHTCVRQAARPGRARPPDHVSPRHRRGPQLQEDDHMKQSMDAGSTIRRRLRIGGAASPWASRAGLSSRALLAARRPGPRPRSPSRPQPHPRSRCRAGPRPRAGPRASSTLLAWGTWR